MAWKEINNQEEALAIHSLPGNKFQGVFLSTKEVNIGGRAALIHQFRDGQDKPVQLWGCTALNDKMRVVKAGTLTLIQYKGKTKSQNGTEYHDVAVYVEDGVSSPNSTPADEPLPF